MRALERCVLTIRHLSAVDSADWLWDRLRPLYEWVLVAVARHGLDRTINGTDRFRVLPRCRHVPEVYEPLVWQHIMAEVRPGEVVADVGAHIGLYTLGLARRVGSSGRVVAFEPDPVTAVILRKHVELNHLTGCVEVVEAVVGSLDGTVPFVAGKGSESSIAAAVLSATCGVDSVRLDTVFAGRRLDVLKIDVEGYEQHVLEGGVRLLADRSRGPRIIYLEVHPYVWPALGTSGVAIFSRLWDLDYRVEKVTGEPVTQIDTHGYIVARRDGGQERGRRG